MHDVSNSTPMKESCRNGRYRNVSFATYVRRRRTFLRRSHDVEKPYNLLKMNVTATSKMRCLYNVVTTFPGRSQDVGKTLQLTYNQRSNNVSFETYVRRRRTFLRRSHDVEKPYNLLKINVTATLQRRKCDVCITSSRRRVPSGNVLSCDLL